MRIEDAVEVSTKTSVHVNLHTLGKVLSLESSEDQAEFLAGLSLGFSELGHSGYMQMAYLAELLQGTFAQNFLENLVDFIRLEQGDK